MIIITCETPFLRRPVKTKFENVLIILNAYDIRQLTEASQIVIKIQTLFAWGQKLYENVAIQE